MLVPPAGRLSTESMHIEPEQHAPSRSLLTAPASAPAIEPTGFVPLPFTTRLLSVFVPLFFLAMAAALDLPAVMRNADLQWTGALIVVGGLALIAFVIAYGLLAGFELNASGVVLQNGWSRRQLAHAQLLSCSVAWNMRARLYMVTLRARSGAAGGTIWLNGDQVRQPGIAKWIASLHRPGDARFAPREDFDDADDGGFINGLCKVLVGLQLACIAWLCVLQGTMLIDDLRLLRHGPAPLESLAVTEGALLGLEPCHRPRRGAPVQYLKVETTTGVREFGIPCLIRMASYDKPGFRHIVIHSDEQKLGDRETYSIELDGVALQTYASHAAVLRSSAGSQAAMHFLLMALCGVIAVYGAMSLPRRARR